MQMNVTEGAAERLVYRQAERHDLVKLVEMLAHDQLGATRETIDDDSMRDYRDALDRIIADANNELIVVEQGAGIVGMFQLTFIPYLTYRGAWRCLVEGVRVHHRARGRGIGTAMFRWAIERAREKACRLIQLTSNKQRDGALRFYEELGFVASHEGFKLDLAAREEAGDHSN